MSFINLNSISSTWFWTIIEKIIRKYIDGVYSTVINCCYWMVITRKYYVRSMDSINWIEIRVLIINYYLNCLLLRRSVVLIISGLQLLLKFLKIVEFQKSSRSLRERQPFDWYTDMFHLDFQIHFHLSRCNITKHLLISFP